VYDKSMKDDYTLFDAFNFLGIHLYGPEWTGYEVLCEREEDPAPTIEARAPLLEEVERLATQYSVKNRELKEVEGREEIRWVNNEIENLRRRQNEVHHQRHIIGDVHISKVKVVFF